MKIIKIQKLTAQQEYIEFLLEKADMWRQERHMSWAELKWHCKKQVASYELMLNDCENQGKDITTVISYLEEAKTMYEAVAKYMASHGYGKPNQLPIPPFCITINN